MSSERAAPDIDFDGDAVAFITDAKLSADDTDDTDDAYVRLDIGAQAERRGLSASRPARRRGADTAGRGGAVGRRLAGGVVQRLQRHRQDLGRSIFMTSLLPDRRAGAGDRRQPPGRVRQRRRESGIRAGGERHPVPGALVLPLGRRTGSGRHERDRRPLRRRDRAPGRRQLRPSRDLGQGKRIGRRRRRCGRRHGGRVRSAASSLPGADGVREEVYVRSARVDVNVSQPAGRGSAHEPGGIVVPAQRARGQRRRTQGDLRGRGTGVRLRPGLRGLSRSGDRARPRVGPDHARQRRAGRLAGQRLRVAPRSTPGVATPRS